MNDVKALTAFFKSLTAMIQSSYGEEGALNNVTQSVTRLQKDSPEFDDPEFQSACNELATAAMSKVAVAGLEEAQDPPSIAAGMAHTGDNPYRKVGKTNPQTGTTEKEQVGDADPAHDHTPKRPQPSVHSTGGSVGDMSAENSKPLV